MPGYRLYKMDGACRFSTAQWIDADDDDAALTAARFSRRPAACELWQADRFVARIEPDEASEIEA